MKRIIVKIGFFTLFITLISSALIPVSGELDTTKIGVKAGDKKTWELTKWTDSGVFAGEIEDDAKKGDTFSIEVVSVALDGDNSIAVKSTDPNGTVTDDRVYLGEYESEIIFTDWSYWKTEMENMGYTIVEDSSVFEYSVSDTETYTAGDYDYDNEDSAKWEYSESREYDKSTGFMNNFHLLYRITHTNGSTSVLEIAVRPESSSDSGFLLGFEFATILATFSLMSIPIVLRRRK